MPHSTQPHLALRDPSRDSFRIAGFVSAILTTLFVVVVYSSDSWIHSNEHSTLVLIVLAIVLMQLLCTGIAFAHANKGWLRVCVVTLTGWIFLVSVGLMVSI